MDKINYTIKIVSKLTGLSTHIIRAWERRYDAVTPMRTSSNRRYYSEIDVQKLKLLSQATAEGFNIGSIASLTVERLNDVLKDKKNKSDELNLPVVRKKNNNSDELASEYLNKCLESISQLRQVDFENILLKASVELNRDNLLNNLVVPLINEIGDRWYHGSLRIAHEHMASSILIAFLQKLRSIYNNFLNKPVIICGTPQGQFHELGALLISVIAASEGYQVIYLGANIPIDEITSVVKDFNARAICLSLVYPENDITVKQYLSDLKKLLNKGTSVIVGGRAALSYQDVIEREGLILQENIAHFQNLIKSFNDINLVRVNEET